jgi:hypothetical protein
VEIFERREIAGACNVIGDNTGLFSSCIYEISPNRLFKVTVWKDVKPWDFPFD